MIISKQKCVLLRTHKFSLIQDLIIKFDELDPPSFSQRSTQLGIGDITSLGILTILNISEDVNLLMVKNNVFVTTKDYMWKTWNR
ncbi:unnamed protein product [Blepharisma stoltei]|uniref:Uncharacterized protein n=1 Tax=Blepharisma stoltei TaxID=1481888 RepID=A0AAU9JC77_9CILI|nr:unnamed protein product [Blepharisma stoltei]